MEQNQTATRNPGSLDALVMRNRYHFQEHRIKPSFQWCEKCVGAEGCYPEGHGPNYLEPACWKGPMTSAEVSHNAKLTDGGPVSTDSK